MMYRRAGIILFTLIVFMFPLSSTAQTTYGLDWGVSVDDEFQYRVDFTRTGYNEEDFSLSGFLLATVIEIPDLSQYSSDEDFPPHIMANVTYLNGTGIGYYDFWIVISHLFMIFPIGNCSHYQHVAENWEPTNPLYNTYFGVRYAEEWYYWSLTYEYSNPSGITNNTYRFSKSDGTLLSATLHTTNLYSRNGSIMGFRTFQFSRVDTVFSIPVIVSSVIIIVEIIIVVEIVRRYRGRKVVADSLTLH
ncbi:MAG: hypothetical protein ACXAEF_01235 [Candidatus Thorarchaeota archaeon]